MSNRWQRRAEVTVGPAEGFTFASHDDQGSPLFRFSFEVQKTSTREPNTASVDIYNLRSDTRDRVQSLDNVFQLRAGYEGRMPIVATGDVSTYRIEREPPDVRVHLEAGDGLRALRDKRARLSYTAGTSVQDVYRDVVEQLGIRESVPLVFSGQFRAGFAFEGRASDALDEVLQSAGKEWSVQQGELVVSDQDQPVGTRPVAVVSPETGLLESPYRLGELNALGWEYEGWRVRMLMEPTIEPGSIVQIESRDISNGLYYVRTVTHSGDTYGDDWTTEMEVIEYAS
ncbi:MAG: phage protein [Spirochaetota bacterium]